MKKLVLAKTGEEVKIGDTIRGIKSTETSFGVIEFVETIRVTAHNVNSLIERGLIKCIEEPNIKESTSDAFSGTDNIGFYVKSLSIRYKKSMKEIIDWLNATNRIYPKAVLDLLLHEISMHFYSIDVEGFDNAEDYYSLRPRDGKVGKVVNINKYVPLFKSAEEAERARKILKKQLEYMYGE
jgi:hypothetical protein